MVKHFCYSSIKILPDTKQTLTNLPKTFKIVPKWQFFGKSSHTGWKAQTKYSTVVNYYSTQVELYYRHFSSWSNSRVVNDGKFRSTVDSFVPSIQWAQVQIPNTPSKYFNLLDYFNQLICLFNLLFNCENKQNLAKVSQNLIKITFFSF